MSSAASAARLLVGFALVTLLFASTAPASAETSGKTPPTTVSFVFTGGFQGQEVAAAILAPQRTQEAHPHREDTIPLNRRPAWTVLGVGIGQVQILFSGLAIATAVVATYRVATRGSRYGR